MLSNSPERSVASGRAALCCRGIGQLQSVRPFEFLPTPTLLFLLSLSVSLFPLPSSLPHLLSQLFSISLLALLVQIPTSSFSSFKLYCCLFFPRKHGRSSLPFQTVDHTTIHPHTRIMAAAVISNSLPQSKFSQGNASSNTSTASKADAVVQSVSTNGLSDNNIDNPYFKELQRYVSACLKTSHFDCLAS